jgi:hypothetical protein
MSMPRVDLTYVNERATMSAKSDWKKILRECERQGARIEPTKNGCMIYPPDKSKDPVNVHRTPSDHRALQNTIGLLRRAGFDL